MHSSSRSPHKPTAELLASLPKDVLTYLDELEAANSRLEAVANEHSVLIGQLASEVLSLKSQLAKDSTNSSKPSSTDGFKKPQSQRKPSGKKPGGQLGHTGHTLLQVSNPDQIELHVPSCCAHCKADLSDVGGECVVKRQVFDVTADHQLCVIEHRLC